uniref:p20 n=2 Tax=Pineapple mealybug wilt-associated virus 2 TaxID=136234 RepID=A0A6M4EG69_9CLOS|nr:p20 [Pineapple mealybug wilt-associated virus 2]UOF87659.1 20 kDa protein [Pineapple mealybug wilt-associated virus 2]WCR39399.1 p20 [Pineapple mealybug wilt-associated virus 2]WCR39409.1 p20 [Pineapple mealybug wilt-associated virus 2]WCR39419.1 p20 [Pineapple mealybug wilt-associated virus 2]
MEFRPIEVNYEPENGGKLSFNEINYETTLETAEYYRLCGYSTGFTEGDEYTTNSWLVLNPARFREEVYDLGIGVPFTFYNNLRELLDIIPNLRTIKSVTLRRLFSDSGEVRIVLKLNVIEKGGLPVSVEILPEVKGYRNILKVVSWERDNTRGIVKKSLLDATILLPKIPV